MQRNSMEDFQRDICHRVLKQEDGTILLTGTIRDRFHDIEVRVQVEPEALTITQLQAEFRAAPTQYCKRVNERLQGLIGFPIGRGLQRKLVEVLGGGEGCGNLRTMLLGLLPLALNIRAAAGIRDEQEMLDAIHAQLAGTCAGYPDEADKTEK